MSSILPTITVTRENYREAARRIRRRATWTSQREAFVGRVIADVKRRGDTAVLAYTKQFDGADLSKRQLRVPPAETAKATGRVDRKIVDALRFSLQRLRTSQRKLLSNLNFSTQMNGFTTHLTTKPLTSVGCYIPGGRAAYPSTVLMTAGLANLAGVQRVAVCTPPDSSGIVNDVVLAAADLCNVDEVYRCGGVQAIAALAYGTEAIPKVDKIVGPGGVYVALAKRHVSKDVAIDFYAGPTEIAVAVDETSDARLAAWDLIAQAEHGEDCVTSLVSVSKTAASRVRAEINSLLPSVERRRFVESSLSRGVTAMCDDWETACDLISELAPEHLELLTRNQKQLGERIRSAGLVLLGSYAPAAASDYCIGTDHVLPTGGFASNHSGLSVLDFLKLTWMVEGTRKGLQSVLEPLGALTKAEGLPNHLLSVESRLQK
jgi:histidinol dehydrogenase